VEDEPDAGAAAVGQKRPAADVAPDSAAAKRTRRFLGSLLVGTLNRAKKEASEFKVGRWLGMAAVLGSSRAAGRLCRRVWPTN
jgi:hypothetical protein